MQEDSHRVHANGLSPAQFFVDFLRIKGVGLPHLQLINRVGGNEIAAYEPRLLRVPLIRLICGPSLGVKARCQDKTEADCSEPDHTSSTWQVILLANS